MSIVNSEQPLRRYHFSAERIDQTNYMAEVAVIAKSEEEARAKAQAEADENNVDWIEEDCEEGYADLTLESSVDLTEEEVEEYLEEQRENENFINDLKQTETYRIHTLLASLRKTDTEEERATLIDELEHMIQ